MGLTDCKMGYGEEWAMWVRIRNILMADIAECVQYAWQYNMTVYSTIANCVLRTIHCTHRTHEPPSHPKLPCSHSDTMKQPWIKVDVDWFLPSQISALSDHSSITCLKQKLYVLYKFYLLFRCPISLTFLISNIWTQEVKSYRAPE